MPFVPTRDDIERLITLCCLPNTTEGSKPFERIALDSALVLRQCEKESGFRQFADDIGGMVLRSSCGALGLFQLLPATAKDLKVDPMDWRQNVWGGVKYDKILSLRFDGDMARVFAAYNWGMGNVDKAVRQYGDTEWKRHVPAETAAYCKFILRAADAN